MRVLFLESGSIWRYTLPNGFRDLGHDVLISGPLTEENIPQMISQFQPDLIISIGWGLDHTVEKQEWIQQHVHKAGIPLIYWAIEDPAFTEVFTLPLIKRMQPDFVFTLCPEKVNDYRQMGIKAAQMDFGFHSSIHHPVESQDDYRASIVVVANAYPEVLKQYPEHFRHISLRNLIIPLLKENIRIDFWGHNWEEMLPLLGVDIPREWIHGPIKYKDANKVYSSAEIVIGLQNYKHIVTQRTFEILASGGFLLTTDTPGVQNLFVPGQDLIVSSSPDETILLVNFYLKFPKKRRHIVENGKVRVSNHSYRQRAETIIHTLIKERILPGDIKQSTDGKVTLYGDDDEDNYIIYEVKKGDHLYGISQKFGVPVDRIKKLNNLTSDIIYIEQILKIEKKE